MDKHTPGPWNHEPYKLFNGDPVIAIYSETDEMGVMIGSIGSRQLEECKANARLIAAAPELLEACELMQREIRVSERYGQVLSIVEAVIKKAKGE